MPGSVVYVRHAMPRSGAGRSTEWRLGPDGQIAAKDLAGRLTLRQPIMTVLSSPEPKAVDSAEPIAASAALDVVIDPRLREVERRWVGAGYRAVAHRYLRGDVPDGWEPHERVAERVRAAVDEAVGNGTLVVVSHGLALALHLAAQLGTEFDPEAFWARLAFPDAWSVTDDGVLARPLRPSWTTVDS